MSDLTRLVDRTALDEGFRDTPYLDSRGLWTFALGRCLETDPLTGAEWKALLDSAKIAIKIDRGGADSLEMRQLQTVEKELSAAYADFWSALNDPRQNALIEMAYQMGVSREESFHEMVAAIRKAVHTNDQADWMTVIHCGLDSNWARETPSRAKRVMTQLGTGVFQ